MTDKNGTEIKIGDLVKRCGNVLYADGLRFKVSKGTWKVSRLEDGKVFYENIVSDSRGNQFVEELELKLPKNEGSFLVVGNEDGLLPEHQPTEMIKAGSVEDKYRVLKEIEKYGWKVGEVVSVVGKVSSETLEGGFLELVSKDTAHQHVLVVVDSIRLNNTPNHG